MNFCRHVSLHVYTDEFGVVLFIAHTTHTHLHCLKLVHVFEVSLATRSEETHIMVSKCPSILVFHRCSLVL